MKVLVTGGAGFIGSHIVDELLEQGYETVVVDNLSTGNREFVPDNVIFYETDITSQQLKEIFLREKPDYVIHQAAQVDVAKSVHNPSLDAEVNILGTINLLSCCKETNVRKIIYASSSAVYGDRGECSIKECIETQPISYYGVSKLTPEMYIKLFQIPYTILRYANVYGPRQNPNGEGGVVSIFCNKLIRGEVPSIFGDGEQVRDFIFVKDVAKANVLALTKGKNKTLNIGCNERITVNELYNMMIKILSKKISPNFMPERSMDIRFSRLNNEKALKELNWCPSYHLSTGLKETIEFYRENNKS
jgi:UDP-glucose 4-epimerase